LFPESSIMSRIHHTFVTVFVVVLSSATCFAQFGGGGGAGGGGFGGGQGGGQGGQGGQGNQGGFQAAGGITIDGNGVLSAPKAKTISPDVAKKRMQELAKQFLPEDLSRSSSLRKVSLVRLERAIAELQESDKPIPESMQYLAGLQRIDFVFVFPETKDLVIAGPAEAFAPDASGRVISVGSGRPVLRLDDLLVAMRTAERTSQFGCSIDPVEERLAELQRFVKTNSSPATANVAQQRFQQMQKILGDQEVKVFGVPNDTHFARALVEADYHMKLIAIGLADPKVPGLKSHLALVQPGGNTLKRWWFLPLYDSFKTSGDGLAFEFSGQRCQLMSQEEQADAFGKRSDAPFTRLSTQIFAKGFTEKFPELTKRMPIFAELQNLFDISVLVALMKREQLPQKANWQPTLLLDDAKVPVLRGPVPKHTKSLLNMKMAGGVAIGLLSGGVIIDSQQVVSQERKNSNEVVARRKTEMPPSDLEAKRWWWD
jgi:hypothetical protein